MAAWKLPLLVVAIAVPTVAGFYVGGPGVGVAVGALVAVAIVVVAVRARPREAIGETPTAGSRRRLLVVAASPVEDQAAIARIAAEAAGGEGRDPAEVLVLAPARIGFLDRWASDLEGARRAAQQNLVITVASLAKAGVAAEARVGDEDLVQAVEDVVGSYAATEVVLVGAGSELDAAAAAAELEERLRVPLLRLSA
ncbi:MAG TPA: hypothetical protein VFJ57_05430 [Solirubrobacterales bacterium]|nr:hypothetical protein [Solirubrobacterales bacterium]